MTILITGGSGFLGRRLARTLLERGSLAGPDGRPRAIDRIVSFDVAAPAASDPRIESIAGDVADPALLARVIDRETTSIFHLAAVVSGMAEADFDLGMRVNLDGTRALLEVCRALGHRPRIVFTSSVAVYSTATPGPLSERTAVTPQTSYGIQKAAGELLMNDYTRRGFVDARVLRLPTISVRPGAPNAAASSFASGIIREPLAGKPAVCPVDADTRMWLLSPSTAIECLITAHDLPSDALGPNRVVNLPGLSVTVRGMVDALERVAGQEVVQRIRWERDPRIAAMVATWPGTLDASRAKALGFPSDDNFDDVIRRYLAESH
jgi:nucleoside-diphosphate-sugar epimerase